MALSEPLQSLVRQVSKEFVDFRDTFALFGLYYTGKITLDCLSTLLYGFKTHLVPYILPNDKWLQSQGEWAIVTGSTHGIGLAYAAELAKRKINIILVARNRDYLDKVAKNFQEKYNVQVATVAVDLSDVGKYELIEKAIADKDIGILVNNAAFNLDTDIFSNNKIDDINRVIDVNVKAVVHITRMVLPQMVKKNKGTIVNVSSMVSCLHPAYLSMYASTKAFINTFTQALQYEYKDTNIFIQCLMPGIVRTQMSVGGLGKTAKSANIDAKTYASGAVRTLGYSNDTTGNWQHGLMYAISAILPRSLVKFLYLRFTKSEIEKVKLASPEDLKYDDLDKILNSK